jgi:hypothetical protein
MRRAVLFLPLGLALALAACGPVALRSDANRAVIQYDPHDATLAEATAVARASCAQYGKRASFYELTGDGRYDALFDCLPQTAQAPPAMP